MHVSLTERPLLLKREISRTLQGNIKTTPLSQQKKFYDTRLMDHEMMREHAQTGHVGVSLFPVILQIIEGCDNNATFRPCMKCSQNQAINE
jgi:hypothetical protein